MQFLTGRLAATAVLILSLVSGGCKQQNNHGNERPQEEKWVTVLKSSLAMAEKRFFTNRYIQNEDPFDIEVVLAALKDPARGLTAHLKMQIEYRTQDYNESWPLIVGHLQRLQKVYSVASVLPAYQIYSMLNEVSDPSAQGGKRKDLDTEMEGAVGELKKIVEGLKPAKRTKDSDGNDVMEVSHVQKLADRISVRALEILHTAPAERVATSNQSILDALSGGVLWLNVRLSEKAHGGLKDDQGVIWKDPAKTLERLGLVYAKMFEELGAQNAGVVERIGDLRSEEAELLKELKFVTDRQFQFARLLARAL